MGRLAAPLVAVALACAPAASAQTIVGTLVDDASLEGIEGGSMTLLDSGQQPIRQVVTDSLGHFAFPVPGVGVYFLKAERIGYVPAQSPSFNVLHTDTLTVTFHVSEQAIVLDPLIVGVRAVTGSELFAEREATGRGVFFSPQLIDSIRPTRHIGELFRHVDDDIFMRWTSGLTEEGVFQPMPVVRSYRSDRGCFNYIVDRTPIPDPFFGNVRSVWGVAPLSEVGPNDIVAMEIYRGWWEVPRDYEEQILANTLQTRRKLRDMRTTECGIVVIWTEEGWGADRADPGRL